MSDAAPLTATAGMESAKAPSVLRSLLPVVLRYAFNALGPISIAGAHFLAALVFLHTLSKADFGLFSFVFVVVPFCLSMTGALFGAALVNSANAKEPMTQSELAAYLKANLVFCGIAAIVIFAMMLGSTATPTMAAVVAVYGALMSVRWLARCHAYAVHEMARAIRSDLVYSSFMLAGLGAMLFTHSLTPVTASLLLAASAFCALLGFGGKFLRAQIAAIYEGSSRAFLPIWRDLARWSLLGVISTEFTANAHAYLVTFFSGPKAFALLALGSLFMRPASLVMQALPDAERATMARALVAGKFDQATRAMAHFRVAALCVLAGTAALAAAIMLFFPEFVLKRGYDETSVVIVICAWIMVMCVRSLRTPDSVLLQAAGEFKSLAAASVRSSLVSVFLTGALLFAFGPLVSLGGILAGELTMWQRIAVLGRKLRARHV